MREVQWLIERCWKLLESGVAEESASRLRSAVTDLQNVRLAVAGGGTLVEAERDTAIEGARELLEQELSHGAIDRAIRQALRARYPSRYTWLRDVFDSWCVFCDEGAIEPEGIPDESPSRLYRLDYTVDEQGAITLGTPVEVRLECSYVAVEAVTIEAERDLAGEFVALAERAVSESGTVSLKLIQPGWGSSGYYPPEVLERDGPKVFGAGTKMYWDHPTRTEEAERPERSLRDLAAELVSDARWEEANPAGPGLYAEAQVFGPYREAIAELAPHIGVSIRALGRAKTGEADGRKGAVIEEISSARSIDFVTVPGAGGQILDLFEAVGRGQPIAETGRLLEEVQAEDARLREALLLREGRDLIAAQLGQVGMADLTRARMLEALAKALPVTDGAIDVKALRRQVEEAVRAELDYLTHVTGAGAIQGMGRAGDQEKPGATMADAQATLANAFSRMGLSESTAALAAAGR